MLTRSEFRPAWWLPGPHLQTLWASLCRRRPSIALRRERLELPDGDFVDLDWSSATPHGPIVIIVHGLEGSSESGYARGLLAAVEAANWRGVVMHFRGCSGQPNRLARSYNAGDTADFEFLLATLRQREPDIPIAAVGYSLGGNMLLKWLGERGCGAALNAAVAVSVPFLLASAADRMRSGVSRIYQRHLLRELRNSCRRKFANMRHNAPVPLQQLDRLQDFFQFDDAITAPLHGYAGVDDYYRRASCRQYLTNIARPTLILHAADDPFMQAEAIPNADELSSQIRLELSPKGGHVGFVSGSWPWRARYWLEHRIPRFLRHYLSEDAFRLSQTGETNDQAISS